MSRFSFAVSGLDSRREGVIESDSFRDAVDALGQHVEVKTGDTLEIGVRLLVISALVPSGPVTRSGCRLVNWLHR